MASFSFFVSLHCTLMCGPLLTAQLSREPNKILGNVLAYNSGRILSYSLMGAALGALGLGLSCNFDLYKRIFAWVTALFLIVIAGLILTGRGHSSLVRPGFAVRLITRLLKPLKSAPIFLQTFMLGFVTIFLPCVTLAPALLSAAASNDPTVGLLFMLSFSLGTVPAMISAAFIPGLWSRFSKSKYAIYIAALFLVMTAFLTLLRAFK